MDDSIGPNQGRRRELQIYEEEDHRNNGAQADDEEGLPLSLSLGPTSFSSRIQPTTSPLPLAPPPPASHEMMASSHPYPSYLYRPLDFTPLSRLTSVAAAESQPRIRSKSSGNEEEDTIPPPFPWATNKRGRIQSLNNLESKEITTITGDVQCKHCEKVYQISYNLKEKFSEIENIFMTRKRSMRERALPVWSNPEPDRCELCGRDKAVKPVIAERKSEINWLFLLLGQTLGYCTLGQLKNFCKHSKSHRTGAKNRVLYLTYLGLCKMLDPNRELFSSEAMTRR